MKPKQGLTNRITCDHCQGTGFIDPRDIIKAREAIDWAKEELKGVKNDHSNMELKRQVARTLYGLMRTDGKRMFGYRELARIMNYKAPVSVRWLIKVDND